MMAQRMVLRRPSEASATLSTDVAIVGRDGAEVLGELERLPEQTTVKAVAAAHNRLVDKLAAAGLASVAEAKE